MYGGGCYSEILFKVNKFSNFQIIEGVGLSCIENSKLFCICKYSTPLHDAVCCGRQEIVKILVERGANVNELDYKSMNPLKLDVRSEIWRCGEDFYIFCVSGTGKRILRLC